MRITFIHMDLHRLIPQPTASQQQRAYEQAIRSSSLTGTFVMMSILSTVIAAYGLLSNSTAVVIGAMLLAPLMGPIFGVAMGLTVGDMRLFRRALAAELIGVAVVLSVSLVIGIMPINLGFGSEVYARTQPTLYDLIIALASGLVGAYALLDERISSGITGVAIATALVPPLTTSGLCLANGDQQMAFGAFMLFVANFLAIQIAGALVFTVFGMHRLVPEGGYTLRGVLQRLSFSLALFAVVAVFMAHTLVRVVQDDYLSRQLRATLNQELGATVGARLSELVYERRTDRLQVVAVLLTPQEYEPPGVARLERVLRERVHPRIDLVVRSLISRDADRRGQVFLPADLAESRRKLESETAAISQARDLLRSTLATVAGAQLSDVKRESASGRTVYTAVVRTPTAIDPTQVASMETALQMAMDKPVRLVVRSVLTRDADAEGYLYQPETDSQPPDETEKRRTAWMERAVRNQLAGLSPVIHLEELRYLPRGAAVVVYAVVRTPQVITPEQVAQMQQAIRRYVHPGTELIVRSVLGADTAAGGYLPRFDPSRYEHTP